MRKSAPVEINRIADMEAAAPPVPALEALRRNLLYAMFQGVSEDDMAAVVSKQVELAKEGDGKAARFLRDMLQAGSSAPTTYMQQAVVVGRHEKEAGGKVYLSDLRRQIVATIAATGPLTTKKVSDQWGLGEVEAREALDHPWFERQANRWHVTNEARNEVLGGEPPALK